MRQRLTQERLASYLQRNNFLSQVGPTVQDLHCYTNSCNLNYLFSWHRIAISYCLLFGDVFIFTKQNKNSPLTLFTDEEESQGDESSKKLRVETFRQKERRKRDMGQATSDKNFVEEEKRILREKADWAVKCWHFISNLSFLCPLTKSTKNKTRLYSRLSFATV